ncbi:hypothetical protein [Candidatus Spongiihabitans sp.]|uniref:hypothetical protein n=1 Tax=Candidatus Spongiihabitans sp. TaxID=3101308 RepID=UPI003C7B7180
MREDWSAYLSQIEIRNAKKEIARRGGASESYQETLVETSSTAGKIVIAVAPKTTNTAARVFEKVWRSVVVIHNGYSQGSGVIIRPNIYSSQYRGDKLPCN